LRVTSDRQTLILAGETPPRRGGDRLASAAVASDSDDAESSAGGRGSQRVTYISARVDAVITQGLYSPPQKVPVGYSANVAANDVATTDDLATANDLVAATSGGQLAVANSASALPALPPKVHQAYVISNRGSSSNGANAYLRTQTLSDRTPIIDTYA
jgi:hypothetical protein